MLGSRKDSGIAHSIMKKHFSALRPEHDEDYASDSDRHTHKEAMHDAMHELHEAMREKDVGRMAKAFAVGHVLAKKYYHDSAESDEEKQDKMNGDIGIKAGYTGYS